MQEKIIVGGSGEYSGFDKVSYPKSLIFSSIILVTCGRVMSGNKIMTKFEVMQKREHITSFSMFMIRGIKPSKLNSDWRDKKLTKRTLIIRNINFLYNYQNNGGTIF